MVSQPKLDRLREVITENLRVQRGNADVEYINVGTALQDACSKQNHAIFARRGCGKTLLLHSSARKLKTEVKSVYLNCEDFKKHSFPNVLIEILASVFREIDQNLSGWFGRKKKSKEIVRKILNKLQDLHQSADEHDAEIKTKTAQEDALSVDSSLAGNVGKLSLKFGAKDERKAKAEVEQSFKIHREKLQELDRWLPQLKESIREFFALSPKTECIIIHIDDLYHLKRTDQAFVVDYIHRLCKDVPMFFKVATLRHASTLYADRDGQPIGIQERHDFQPINIDYTFGDFKKTVAQNSQILEQFGKSAGLTKSEILSLFKGEGFERLVMAGGGVPRDVLSLFLEALSEVGVGSGNKIGKDEVRLMSRPNFERKIDELKQDSKGDEQDDLIKGIYTIREFCMEKKTNLFLVQERMLQQNDEWKALFNRLLDYRIIHNCATALTHKSQQGTYQAFAIDIGAYAQFRKLDGRFNEIGIMEANVKEKMRSAPILDQSKLLSIFQGAPTNIESALRESILIPSSAEAES
ncbi:hypothetical protein ABS770_13780 [Methylobacterium brachiatum]|uniref:Orc1-like AAA ATPase domain-containing protein n=2 Tax=Methylobacterium brachiatum TaxID=269660 RepID=A0ABV1R3F4_9HYPH